MDLGMNGKPPFRPSGKLARKLEHCGDLATRYLSFLSESDPLEDWGDVAPLAEPIAIEKQYPVDWDLVRQLAAVCPSLTRVASAVEMHDVIAPSLGLRYAWSRFSLHARLLNAMEVIFPSDGLVPTMILEPGCFTGGLLHFLANLWQDIPTVGFDLSPVSLDVLKHLSGTLCLQKPPLVIRADYTTAMVAIGASEARSGQRGCVGPGITRSRCGSIHSAFIELHWEHAIDCPVSALQDHYCRLVHLEEFSRGFSANRSQRCQHVDQIQRRWSSGPRVLNGLASQDSR